MKPENELVKLAKSGSRDAFNELVRKCAGGIYRLTLHLTGNTSEAEDLWQDSVLHAYERLDRFNHGSSFATWLYRLTVNCWKDRVKYEKRRSVLKFLSLDRALDERGNPVRSVLRAADTDPSEEAEKSQKREIIHRILDRLEDTDRLVIIMRDMEGRSYDEIADMLGCPLGTVKSRIARARESLREKYLKIFKE